MKKIKVKSVKSVKNEPVFAIKTSTKTFIANGLAMHNCASSNYTHQHNTIPFTKALIEKYGVSRLDEINAKSKESFKKPKKLVRLEELKAILAELKKQAN